jgi:hypothetical protein
MITAIVLINVETEHIPEAAQRLVEIDGITEVYSVAGRHDLIAMIRVAEHDQIAEVVTVGIAKVPGVASTETLIAFRAYSQHDLDAAFSLGYEQGA